MQGPVAVKRAEPYVRKMPDGSTQGSPSDEGQDRIASGGRSGIVRLYFAGLHLLGVLTRLLRMVYIGIWLGLLTRGQLHAVSERKYSLDQRYWTDGYNKAGLWDWESKVVDRDFAGCKRLLLAAAGGGREVIALRRRGIEVEAFESDPGLVRFANELLEREGMVPDIKLAPWDGCPDSDGECDGIIVGWGAYMHIRGRERRIKFLRELRRRVVAGSPILLSFSTRVEGSPYFRGIARIGNVLALMLRRDPIEVGDSLVPNYAHYFTKGQLESEMVAAGFELVSFERIQYGHAVGRAVGVLNGSALVPQRRLTTRRKESIE